ncbi:type II toxin-antitoxin system VapB family antitoxin [Prosthecomicrobium pneumaticum]|uniref:Antitoxin VapB n=1 Tax=Prosthecomicrobium pneumaticum TaxID=81895 RepID=A0A7W9L2V6_9HYPH|nr:type II toxin-antitoxin system VapB family antitoxin [Prosthecomicrobium pneumaticum]MBB5753879.1 antitoxin VapB [Prosthecomicrobium pneumaticum]
MPLYIRDDTVATLAREVQRLTKAETMTDAVRLALVNEIERIHRQRPAAEQIAKALAMADAMGENAPDFDFRTFSDELWER